MLLTLELTTGSQGNRTGSPEANTSRGYRAEPVGGQADAAELVAVAAALANAAGSEAADQLAESRSAPADYPPPDGDGRGGAEAVAVAAEAPVELKLG